MTYIYKITNDINNKVYIGQTESPLKKRLQQHYKDFLKNHKKVFAYTKDNKFIGSFESTVEAAKWCYENKKCKVLNAGVRSHISEVARGKRKSAYGYIWKYDE